MRTPFIWIIVVLTACAYFFRGNRSKNIYIEESKSISKDKQQELIQTKGLLSADMIERRENIGKFPVLKTSIFSNSRESIRDWLKDNENGVKELIQIFSNPPQIPIRNLSDVEGGEGDIVQRIEAIEILFELSEMDMLSSSDIDQLHKIVNAPLPAHLRDIERRAWLVDREEIQNLLSRYGV